MDDLTAHDSREEAGDGVEQLLVVEVVTGCAVGVDVFLAGEFSGRVDHAAALGEAVVKADVPARVGEQRRGYRTPHDDEAHRQEVISEYLRQLLAERGRDEERLDLVVGVELHGELGVLVGEGCRARDDCLPDSQIELVHPATGNPCVALDRCTECGYGRAEDGRLRAVEGHELPPGIIRVNTF